MALLGFVLWAPWYLTAAFIVVFALLFEKYWEAVVAALVIDSFYSLPGRAILPGFGLFTLSSLLILYVLSLIKNKIRL